MSQCHEIAAGITQQCDDGTNDAAEDLSANQPQLALDAPTLAASMTKACALCGNQAVRLLLCTRCKSARYCHAEHQRQHWFSFICVFKIFYGEI